MLSTEEHLLLHFFKKPKQIILPGSLQVLTQKGKQEKEGKTTAMTALLYFRKYLF